MEKVGMRERSRESELVETPPHRAEIWFFSVPCGPLPASGAREASVSVARSLDPPTQINALRKLKLAK
jgi:hypothetical protein